MATGKLIGIDTAGGSQDGSNWVIFNKFTASGTGIVSQIKVYSLVAGNAKVAIYTDNAGAPADKIVGNDTGQACLAGQWNTLTIADANVVSGTPYWLGFDMELSGVVAKATTGGVWRGKVAYYSSWTWPANAGSGYSPSTSLDSIAGWGILVLSPSSISQPLSYGTPTLNLTIKPSGLVQLVAIGTPALRYPQTITPTGISQAFAFGTPSVAVYGSIGPSGIAQLVSFGSPTILKYVWHVILDGQYLTETPEINRSFVIGRDDYGNPVWGEAHDTTESALVGERLDFQQELAIPTAAQAASTAESILSKMRLTTKKGLILIPPNCGQELFDTVELSDAGANQSAVKFRVVGLRFEYNPKQARYHHKLILGAP